MAKKKTKMELPDRAPPRRRGLSRTPRIPRRRTEALERLDVLLPASMRRRLEEEAEHLGQTVSAIVRLALGRFFIAEEMRRRRYS